MSVINILVCGNSCTDRQSASSHAISIWDGHVGVHLCKEL